MSLSWSKASNMVSAALLGLACLTVSTNAMKLTPIDGGESITFTQVQTESLEDVLHQDDSISQFAQIANEI